MLTYWLMYLVPASLMLFMSRRNQHNLLIWLLIGVSFALLIGFRYQVGGDWPNYLRHYESAKNITLIRALEHGDPGHSFLNWLAAWMNWGVYGINICYGTVFAIGLTAFSRNQPQPWVAFAVAVPYLVIVVAMGYSRQGIAIGLFLLAITYLQKGKFKTYIFLILFAALFHKTAILLMPLGVFIYGKGGMLRILMIIPLVFGGWSLFIQEQQEQIWHNYVEANLQSEGAKIRVFMNFVPSLLFLWYRKEWQRSFNDYSFWLWIALGSIISLGLVDAASTAVDRIALYFIPIQLVVYARLPYLARNQMSPDSTKLIIFFGYAAVLFVWLNYASHSHSWLPYQNILMSNAQDVKPMY